MRWLLILLIIGCAGPELPKPSCQEQALYTSIVLTRAGYNAPIVTGMTRNGSHAETRTEKGWVTMRNNELAWHPEFVGFDKVWDILTPEEFIERYTLPSLRRK
jgi:hypothetical protein